MTEKDNITGIAPALGGIFIPIVLFVLIFAKEQAWILAPIAFAFALLGIGVAYFAVKTPRRR
jgi:VIT1/CCC1 family predicted Fe2+/Mn2+ transporter